MLPIKNVNECVIFAIKMCVYFNLKESSKKCWKGQKFAGLK